MAVSAVYHATHAKLCLTAFKMATPPPLRSISTHSPKSQSVSQLRTQPPGPHCLQRHSLKRHQCSQLRSCIRIRLTASHRPKHAQHGRGGRAAHSFRACSCSPSSEIFPSPAEAKLVKPWPSLAQQNRVQVVAHHSSWSQQRQDVLGLQTYLLRYFLQLCGPTCTSGCIVLLKLLCTVLPLVACPAAATWACFGNT